MAEHPPPIEINPIGIIHSPYTEAKNTPIQGRKNLNITAEIEIFPEYVEGLTDIEGFSNLIVIYHFHQIRNSKLVVIPYMDSEKRGVYATRSPARPNHLGFTVVNLIRREGSRLVISGIDMLSGTPVIDIKPYIPQVDQISNKNKIEIGWLEDRHDRFKSTVDDGRFEG
jgi:tRNA-Thr(GGU) m(6)t(6)A37 methyltransferase TsaA